MTVVRRIARPLLAAPYVASGVDAVRHPGPRVEGARPFVTQLSRSPLPIPNDPLLVVRVAGGATAAAGVLLALGKAPRLSSLVLLAAAVPSARTNHPFWEAKDAETKRTERALFLKDLGLLGGAILAAVDTEGQPGVSYRSRLAAKDAKRAAKTARTATKVVAHDAALTTALTAKDLRLSARSSRKGAGKKVAKAQKEALKSAVKAQKELAKKAGKAQRKAVKKASKAREALPV